MFKNIDRVVVYSRGRGKVSQWDGKPKQDEEGFCMGYTKPNTGLST